MNQWDNPTIEDVTKAEPVMIRREVVTEEMQKQEGINPIALLLANGPKPAFDEEFNERIGIWFRFRNISPEKYKEIMDRTEKWIRFGGNLQQTQDTERANILLIIEACTEPNLRDPAFAAPYRGNTEEAVRQTILPGEIIKYADKVLRLIGFTAEVRTENAIASKVKNS